MLTINQTLHREDLQLKSGHNRRLREGKISTYHTKAFMTALRVC